MQDLDSQKWHSIDSDNIIKILESNIKDGLDDKHIQNKLKLFGLNILKEKKPESKLQKFFSQFHNALIYILLSASLITAALSEWIDSGVIFAVVIINVIIGYIQEVKAQEAIESLKTLMITQAKVLRDGEKSTIPSIDLVPGDIILLESGSKIPADIRLLQMHELEVDESMLTGESLPVYKSLNLLAQNTTLNDRKNMCYSGTYVTYGRAKGIVVGTGNNTEIGKIAHLLEETTSMQTPLTKKISSFSKLLLYVILALATFTFIVGILKQNSAVDMFMASVALAVGAIPEGLPAAVTITLAIGVSAMAKKNAIIRKLPAVETLGSVTTICSDKTGTLTQNKMTVTNIYCSNKKYLVSGNGYEPRGDFFYENKKIEKLDNNLKELLLSGYLCNESHLKEKDNTYSISGDPTEGALLVSALKSELTKEQTEKEYKKLDILPFESDKQYMATLHKKDNKNIIYLKGSIEKTLKLCNYEQLEKQIEPIDKEKILSYAEEYAKNGLRVLAIAKKVITKDKIDAKELEDNFVFLGLQTMMDPPRKEAIKAVKDCINAGIKVIMITGDHALTAFSIAKKMNIIKDSDTFKESVLKGSDLINLKDKELIQKVENINIFARVEPEQKLHIVNALQANGEIVAMTGDGVNDAPALKQANIGVAMGKAGTEVAKEAADMILSDDNFSSIASAVKEGRNVFDNLIKFITWTLPTNLGEGLVILFAIMLGVSLPILPVQILWINMSTAILLGLMLVFEPDEKNIMKRPPREPNKAILTKSLIIQMLLVGFYMLLCSYSMFNLYLDLEYSKEYARTVSVNIFVFIELFYLFSCKELQHSIFKTNLLNNPNLLYGVVLMSLVQILFTHTHFMNIMFKSEPLELKTWLEIISISFCVIFVVEIKSIIENRLLKRTTQ